MRHELRKNACRTEITLPNGRQLGSSLATDTPRHVKTGVSGWTLGSVLDELWNHLKSLGSEPVILCVPGNHDLERPESHDPIVKALRLWHKDKEIRDVFWNTAENQYKKAIEKYFENYSVWLEKSTLPKSADFTKGFLPGDFSTRLVKGDRRIGIVGLNTAFLQLTDDNYEKKLELHEKQLSIACSGDALKWKSDLDLVFLVSHHPPSWLSPKAEKTYNTEIAPPGMFHAHICGHLHEPKCFSFSEGGSEERRIWQGPSIFGLKSFGKDSERVHGYNSCRVEFDEENVTVSIWPRKMTQKYSGRRMLGPDPGYELGENNAVVKEFKGKHKYSEPVPSTVAVVSEKLEIKGEGEVNIEASIEVYRDSGKLTAIPRLMLTNEPQHWVIRSEEQKCFRSYLTEQKILWLISDWGQGKLGFISAALKDSDVLSQPTIYHLQCEEMNFVDELPSLFEQQFGMTAQEFINITSDVLQPVIYLDKLPPEALQETKDIERFTEIIAAIKDYNVKLHLILDCRKEVKGTNIPTVKLKALDIVETKTYVSQHPDATINIISGDAIEHLYMWSDGLPMYLDYLIKSLKVTQFKDLISVEVETKYDELQQAEPVPKAFLHAVGSLGRSDNRYSRRSYKMLKVLTVLSDGSMLEKIKRFDNSEPFFYQNALELEALGLIDIIPVTSLEPEIGRPQTATDAPRLLRVPKQVRDYVKSIIAENEYSAIIMRSADMLFGDRWKQGKFEYSPSTLRRLASASPSGLGNEHVVIRQLVWEAIHRNDSELLNKIMLLAISFINKLNALDRFKEAYFAAEELIHIMSDSDFTEHKAELLLAFGKAARMVGKRDEAIDVIRRVIDNPDLKLPKDILSSANLTLALAYESIGNKEDALEAASIVTKFERKGSSRYDQALSVIIEINNDVDALKKLKELEVKSRRLNRWSNANNIAITLAKKSSSVEAKISYYNSVIDGGGDDYNRVRAVINKTDELLKAKRYNELRQKDKQMLQAAFSYCYSQGISSLFNQCTKVIWDLLSLYGRYDQVIKLFKYSSFVWRLRGEHEVEEKYMKRINSLSDDVLSTALESDLRYFSARMQNLQQ